MYSIVSDTAACIRPSVACDVVVRGDWDQAILDYDPVAWPPHIDAQIRWLRTELKSSDDASLLLETLQQTCETVEEAGFVFAMALKPTIASGSFAGDYDKILATPEIDNMHGKRLFLGR